MSDSDLTRLMAAAAGGTIVLALALWAELLLRRPLAALLFLVLAIFAGAGVVVYDLQTETPSV